MKIKETVNNVISQEDLMRLMDTCYQKAVDGLEFVIPSVDEMASDYTTKYKSVERASKEMIKTQIIKCTTSGVVTGLGGLITLPVAIPANLASVLYVQLRMIACAAHMAGYDVKNDRVQTLIYACLAGVTVNAAFKKTGVKIGEKMAMGAINKIPGKAITTINQKVGFRLVTKFGETGVINLGKMVPGVGAVVNGSLDLIETRVIGKRAYNWFIKGNFACDDKNDEQNKEFENIIDINEKDIRKHVG